MDFSLTHKRRPDGTYVVSVPFSIRIMMGIIALVFIGSAFIPGEGGEFRGLGIAGISVSVITLLALFYEERWTFDGKKKTVRFRFGLYFAAKVLSFPFEDVEEIKLERFRKGKAGGIKVRQEEQELDPGFLGLKRIFTPKSYMSLVMYLKNSNRLVVETARISRSTRIKELGIDIANILEKDLIEE